MKEITLQDAETRLDALIDAGDETGWQAVAQVLAEVEASQAWRQGGHHSYSAWVRDYARRKGCSESLLWKYQKAGRAYERARAKAPDLPPLGGSTLSSQTISTVEKICGDDAEASARLIGRVTRGEVRPSDVEAQWRAARKVAGTRKSRHDRARATNGADAGMTRSLTQALVRDAASWIWGAETPGEAEERRRREAPRAYLTRDAVCVRTLEEFPVRVEGSERARRVDLAAVCVENQTTADWMDVVLRGVEVKASVGDLERDAKMGDYGLFMDYMYIACPSFMVAEASDHVPVEWGVLAYDAEADRVSVVREPERLDAPRREDALMTVCVKLATARR